MLECSVLELMLGRALGRALCCQSAIFSRTTVQTAQRVETFSQLCVDKLHLSRNASSGAIQSSQQPARLYCDIQVDSPLHTEQVVVFNFFRKFCDWSQSPQGRTWHLFGLTRKSMKIGVVLKELRRVCTIVPAAFKCTTRRPWKGSPWWACRNMSHGKRRLGDCQMCAACDA